MIHTILERISDGFVAFDKDFNYVYVNEAGAAFLGCQVEDLIGKNYWELYPEAKGTPFANAYVRAMETQKPIFMEEYYEHWDKWFTNRIFPSEEGLSIFFSDVTNRKKTESSLLKAIAEKNTLIQELHHRIKNNLQMVVSIMYLKTNGLTDQATKDFAKDINSRILAVATIHEHLLAIQEINRLPIGPYISRLVKELIKMSASDNKRKVSFAESIIDVEFAIDDALALGMIVHEAVSNSLEHAFHQTDQGTITVSLTESEGAYHLQVNDDGSGYEPELVDSSSIGHALIQNFAKQLKGSLSIHSDQTDKGTIIEVSFPVRREKD